MAGIAIKVSIPNLPALEEALRNYPQIAAPILDKAVRTGTVELFGQVQRATPVRSGALRETLEMAFGTLWGAIRPTRYYAVYVHQGTGPHDIYPKAGKALYWPGAAHPVRMVHHPGTRANPFLVTAANAGQQKVFSIFAKAMDDIAASIANKVNNG